MDVGRVTLGHLAFSRFTLEVGRWTLDVGRWTVGRLDATRLVFDVEILDIGR